MMNTYTIYCTEEQTKKALELGAPIEDDGSILSLPTAEQMIGWLEEQNILIEYTRFMGKYAYRLLELHDNGERNLHIQKIGSSRKEATLAAIDAALDYLIKNKK